MEVEENRQGLRRGKSLREQVYKRLKDNILTGVLEAQTRLVEEKIAAQLGTSRTPVREAIQKLEKEGLIYKLPKGGFAVRSITEEDLEEVFEIRSMLEGYAGYLATLRITDEELSILEEIVRRGEERLEKGDLEALVPLNTEFHERLYKASKSRILCSLINDLRDFIYRFRVIIFKYPNLAEISLRDHREMIELMRLKKGKKVEALIKKHILRGKKLIKEKIREEGKIKGNGS